MQKNSGVPALIAVLSITVFGALGGCSDDTGDRKVIERNFATLQNGCRINQVEVPTKYGKTWLYVTECPVEANVNVVSTSTVGKHPIHNMQQINSSEQKTGEVQKMSQNSDQYCKLMAKLSPEEKTMLGVK